MKYVKGAIGEGVDSRDYVESHIGREENTKRVSKTFSNLKYNQKEIDDYSCTSAAAIGVISDVTNFGLPKTFRKEVWENQLLTGAIDGVGDTVQNGMKQSVKKFNAEFPELPYYLEYKRIEDIRNINKLLSVLKFSSISTGYYGNLYRDAQDNGIIDNNDNDGENGHCVRIIKAWMDGRTLYIKFCDNYEGVNKFNVIEVPDFKNNKDFFKGGYYLRKVFK